MTNKRLTKKLLLLKKIEKQIETLWENDFFYLHSMFFFLSQKGLPLFSFFAKTRTHAFSASLIVFIGATGSSVFFPSMANADIQMRQVFSQEERAYGNFPVAEDSKPKKIIKIPITAYTSDEAQTDSTPCITASGMNVCERNREDIVAANFLPIGTRIRIPELYGDRIFSVQDRMNARYHKHMDVWMKDYSEAKQFGLKYSTIEIF